MKDESYWLKAAEDIKRVRKGRLTKKDLIDCYPELNIQDDYLKFDNIKESIYINIPAECLPRCVAIIAFAADPRPQDVNRADRWLTITIAYRPEWEKLLQVGELRIVCKERKKIKFNNNYIDEGRLVLRRCIEEGERADDYGIGTESDTWLICELNADGNMIVPFYIER